MESSSLNAHSTLPAAARKGLGSAGTAANIPFASPTEAFMTRLEERNALMQKLTSTLAQGWVLAQRLESARELVLSSAPLDLRLVESPTDSEAAATDLLVYRYTRLQDLLAESLFPALLEAGAEVKAESAFGDKLRALQRLGVIDSADDWLELRALRNEMARHDIDPGVHLALLNEALESAAALVGALRAANHYARNKLGL